MKQSELKNLEKFVKKIVKNKPNDLKQPSNPPSLKEQNIKYKYNKKSGMVEELNV